jgi:hypothetical protein
MPPQATFDEILEAVEHLPPDQQADLLQVIQRRLAATGRQRVVDEVRDAQAQFDSGGAKHSSIDDIMREIDS